ncbi:FadD3 family acyl-CoA ligase [Gammaproteobacteria bacterium]|nr:FadD3 family acyl-CoA ligase [Gammaproteobacteria bacterium]
MKNLSSLTIPALIKHQADNFGSKPALISDYETLSFLELDNLSTNIATHLIDLNILPGDRVAIWAPNMNEWVLAAIAIHKVGGVLVPINTRMKGKEAAYILNNSESKILFSVNTFLGTNYFQLLENEDLPYLKYQISLDETEVIDSKISFSTLKDKTVDAQLPEVIETDMVDIIFTSGTTGKPKGVISTHLQNIKVFDYWSSYIGLNENDRYLIVNPFFHTFGYKAGWLASVMRGVTAYPCPIFDADKIIQIINKEKITMLPGPPTLYQSILTSQLIETIDISSLRLGVTGAASIPIQLIKDMKETLGFETVITAYGLTESTGVVTMCTPNDDYETIATTSGCAIADVEVKCVDQNNKVLPAGEPGEILVRGYNITQGYFNNPEATQEAIDTHGWLHTGDIGILDSNGYIKITDRSKDMFIVGGFNAYPAEIENILCDHPAISQAAVIGIEDERMGEVAKAFVLLKPNQDLDADSLLQWSKDNMANYKVPREVEFVRELPTNAAGKIMKYLLKDES